MPVLTFEQTRSAYLPAPAGYARAYPFAMRQVFGLFEMIAAGRLDVTTPDGRAWRFEGAREGPRAALHVRDFAFARAAARGDIGVAESYMRGDWDTPDLTAFLELFCVNQPVVAELLEKRPWVRLAQMARHWLNRNTRAGARRNIHAHYDLGNEFYAAWLDPSMTYSSALGLAHDGDLAAAQQRKYAALADDVGVKPDQRIVEIGCGWGGFAEFAAARGAHVTGLTISPAQQRFFQARMARAGLGDRARALMLDYRDARGQYDALVSIEMFEAVGEEYWPHYFAQARALLKPGGRAGLQIITIDENLFARYRRELDFIRRYIFPGGMLPTRKILHDLAAAHGLNLVAERAFGFDYATTLASWRERFLEAFPRISALGFDETFRRMWTYYLSYCEAGFRARTIDVRHLVFERV